MQTEQLIDWIWYDKYSLATINNLIVESSKR